MIGEVRFAELCTASNFSFLHGASHPEELAMTASALGLEALGLCDRNSMAGVVRAHMAAKEVGLAFVPGCRLAFLDGTPDLLVWPKHREGYGRLTRLLTVGNRRAEKGSCHLVQEDLDLLDKGCAAALVLPAGLPRPDTIKSLLLSLKDRFGPDLRLAVSFYTLLCPFASVLASCAEQVETLLTFCLVSCDRS